MCKAGLPGKFSATPGKNSWGFYVDFVTAVDSNKVNDLIFFDHTANYSARILLSLNAKRLSIQENFFSFSRCT